MKKPLLFFFLIALINGRVVSQVKYSDHKVQTAKSVYDELINAFGDGRTAPELKFILKKDIKDSIVAAFTPGDAPAIELEELAYDVCTTFGKDSLNALACILGHELSHYYLRHDWCSNFSRRLSHISIATDLNKIDKQEQLKKETEADYNGFYFGNVAGYKTFDIAPNLLRKLYSTYKLNSSLKGYPTLEQRVEAARQSKIMVLRRLPVFEAGSYLYAIGEYEMAFDCFNNLLSDFTSRENYNNAAVCKMQLALDLFEPYEMPFRFPFELDYETRITGSSNRSGAPQTEEKRKAYLADARKLLDESIRRDPNYSKAKINLAICYIMSGNPDMASGILKEIETDSSVERKVLSAICTARKSEFTKALQELSSIIVDDKYTDLITSNVVLFNLAKEKKLKIGDDELGYQLRKLRTPSSINGIKNEMVDKVNLECFDSTSKALMSITDSVKVSMNSELFILNSIENYDKGILIKNQLSGKSIILCFSSVSNRCSTTKATYTIYVIGDSIRVFKPEKPQQRIVYVRQE